VGTLLPYWLWAQETKEVQGIVMNAAQEPIMGVSIGVKNSTQGTTTDNAGRFALKVPTNATLVFSFVGFDTKEVPVGSSNSLIVTLVEGEKVLEEVVVTALGIERKTRTLAYATQQVNADQVNEVRGNSGNIMNSLSGKVAGAVITPAATGPGSAAKIVLRGNKSISGNNNALIVVDGVPFDNSTRNQATSTFNSYGASDGAANINPDDVESINILKGPSAAALYGSRAANGAIIITTKKGNDGKVAINYNGGFSVEQPNLLMGFQDIYGRGNGGVADPAAGESWGAATETYPDNVKSFFRTTSSINNSLNFSGGTENIQGYASYTNNQNGGVIPGNNLDRNTLNLRVNANLLPKLKTDAKITYLNQDIKNKPRQGDTGTSMGTYIMPRDMSESEIKDYEGIDPATGEPLREYWTNSSVYDNPYWDINRTSVNEIRNRITLLGSVTYELTDWLSVMGRYSYDRYDDKETGSYYDGTKSLGNVQKGGMYYERLSEYSERNMDILVTGENALSEDFKINYNVGASLLNRKSNSVQNMANGLSVPNKFNLAFAKTPAFNDLFVSDREMQSVYGSVQIGFKELLYLDLSARNDWSSTLPAPHSYFYPSVGISAIVSDMFAMPEWISFAKIRGSYTQVGNDADPYLLSQLYNFSLGAQEGFINRNANRAIGNLKPEKTDSKEIGIDWKFFNNRLGIDATVYKSNTKNQLLFIGLPMASGFGRQYINAGNIENKGLEISLNGSPIKKEDFVWNSSINFSRNINTIKELTPEISQADLSSSTRMATVVAKVGGSYGDLYGSAWKRNENGTFVVGENGLPVRQTNQKLGNFNPDFMIGWSNSFNYKRFDLTFLIDGRVGGELVSGTDSFLGSFGIGDYTEEWREGGLILPAVFEDGSANTAAINSQQFWTTVSQGGRDAWGEFFTYSATNFRLRELSLAYNIPLGNTSLLRNAKVSLYGNNLFFFYRGKSKLDIKGMERRTIPIDPEAALGIGNYQGVEAGLPPSVRSFGLNLKVSF